MRKIVLYCLVMLFLPCYAIAQQDSIVSMSDNLRIVNKPSVERQKWEFHATMGGSVVGGSLGTASVFAVNPSVVYRPNEKLTVKASLAGFNSYSFIDKGYRFGAREPYSMAPVRERGATAVGAHVSVSYKVNERLWVAASLTHIGGDVATGAVLNPWYATPMPLTLDATAFSASLRYKMGENSFLDVHFTHIEDREGTLMPMLYDGYLASPYRMGPFHGFFDY